MINGDFAGSLRHSILIPAALITLAHFPVSDLM